jgi:hypothetical protein
MHRAPTRTKKSQLDNYAIGSGTNVLGFNVTTNGGRPRIYDLTAGTAAEGTRAAELPCAGSKKVLSGPDLVTNFVKLVYADCQPRKSTSVAFTRVVLPGNTFLAAQVSVLGFRKGQIVFNEAVQLGAGDRCGKMTIHDVEEVSLGMRRDPIDGSPLALDPIW